MLLEHCILVTFPSRHVDNWSFRNAADTVHRLAQKSTEMLFKAILSILMIGVGASAQVFNYNVWQQTFGQAWSAYAISNATGDAATLQKLMAARLPESIKQYNTPSGSWTPAWGPAVYQSIISNKADNVWFASFCPSVRFEDGKLYPTWVISVAGTQQTLIDYLDDIDVGFAVDLDVWATDLYNMPSSTISPDPSHAQIHSGVADAIYQILTSSSPSSALPLNKWLTQVSTAVTQPTKFIFTGHSEGGPISHALAYLYVKSGTLKKSSTVDVRFYPIAAPATSNQVFVSASQALFPPTAPPGLPGYAGWNLNIVNTLDSVPHAWCSNANAGQCGNYPYSLTLSNVNNMYNCVDSLVPFSLCNTEVGGMADALIGLTDVINMVYWPQLTSNFTGRAPTTVPTGLDSWGDIAWNQHVQEYCWGYFQSLTTPYCG